MAVNGYMRAVGLCTPGHMKDAFRHIVEHVGTKNVDELINNSKLHWPGRIEGFY